jgi:hypothetical protein
MSKKRAVSINYTSREFDSIKRDLIDYIRRYYPNTYRDFNEASFGSLMIDAVSYIGDILSFYIDYQVNETFLETATEYENVLKLGKQLGYKFTGSASSYGMAAFYIMVPAYSTGMGPDERYIPILKKGSQFGGNNDSGYILNHDVHFGHASNETRVARVDETTGNPTHYVIKSYGEVVSGIFSEEEVEIGPYQRYRTVDLVQEDIAEIISVYDTEGNQYYEVDYLSQNVIYRGVTNRSKTYGNEVRDYATGDQAAEILKPFVVPRRFVVERKRRETSLTFGSGTDMEVEKDFITEPQTAILELPGKNYFQDTSYDPSRIIRSDKMGVAPSNTTLFVKYRVNSLETENLRVGQLRVVSESTFEFPEPDLISEALMDEVTLSLEVDNEEPIVGDVTIPDSDELKIRVRDNFASQHRAVTQQDYESYIYQMPPRFGAIKRCRVLRDHDSLRRNLNIYVLSEDESGLFTNSNMSLKNNLKSWLLKGKMVNDTIDILDARVLNLSIDFVAVGALDNSKFEVLQRAKDELIEHFSRKPDIGEPFFITDVYKVLRNIEGILDVTDVKIRQLAGPVDGSARVYSSLSFPLVDRTSQDGRYIDLPKNVAYEIKYPDFDIRGVIV